MKRCFELRAIFHHPAVDGGVIDRGSTFAHELFDVAGTQGIGHIPAHAREENILWEVARVRPWWISDRSVRHTLYDDQMLCHTVRALRKRLGAGAMMAPPSAGHQNGSVAGAHSVIGGHFAEGFHPWRNDWILLRSRNEASKSLAHRARNESMLLLAFACSICVLGYSPTRLHLPIASGHFARLPARIKHEIACLLFDWPLWALGFCGQPVSVRLCQTATHMVSITPSKSPRPSWQQCIADGREMLK